MASQIKTKVPLDMSTVTGCKCPGCPVQAKSQCVAKLKGGLGEALKMKPLKAEKIPGAYCGSGKATCTDLDPAQGCVCPGCSIFAQYKLASGKPVGYFCRDGAAV